MSSTRVHGIGYWPAEYGYLVRGARDEAHARELVHAHILATWRPHPEDYCNSAQEAADRESRAAYTATCGWYRFNPAPRGDDHTHYMEDAKPGERGAFAAVYLERPW